MFSVKLIENIPLRRSRSLETVGGSGLWGRSRASPGWGSGRWPAPGAGEGAEWLQQEPAGFVRSS